MGAGDALEELSWKNFPDIPKLQPFRYNRIAARQLHWIAPLAQLDRASGYEPEGREFESLRAHHYFHILTAIFW